MAQVEIAMKGQICTVTLNRAERHNSLTLPFMRDVEGALTEAAASDARLILLRATGRSFSTGGDINGFLGEANDPGALQTYAANLVGALNSALMTMIKTRQPVITAVQGLVTGGSAGFLFASDFCLMAEGAFLQPYYGEVGFAPDGGWTALLPDIIGHRRAMEIILQNRRVDAGEALELGIAHALAGAGDFEAETAAICSRILSQDMETLCHAKRLLWTESRCEQARATLEAERQAFLEAIRKPECVQKMKAFVAPRTRASNE